MSELADVRDILIAFEEHNRAKVTLTMELVWGAEGPDICVEIAAHDREKGIGEAPSLASVRLKCSALNLKHVTGVVIHALYALDFQLALNELASVEPQKA
jgi:hypothetical protein